MAHKHNLSLVSGKENEEKTELKPNMNGMNIRISYIPAYAKQGQTQGQFQKPQGQSTYQKTQGQIIPASEMKYLEISLDIDQMIELTEYLKDPKEEQIFELKTKNDFLNRNDLIRAAKCQIPVIVDKFGALKIDYLDVISLTIAGQMIEQSKTYTANTYINQATANSIIDFTNRWLVDIGEKKPYTPENLINENDILKKEIKQMEMEIHHLEDKVKSLEREIETIEKQSIKIKKDESVVNKIPIKRVKSARERILGEPELTH